MAIVGAVARGFSVAEASGRMKGDPGTEVTLVVEHLLDGRVDTATLRRERIAIPGVPYAGWVADGIGYVQHSDFTEGCYDDLRAAVEGLAAEGDLRGLILDYRNNGGGILQEAVKILSMFVPKGTEVVTTRGRTDNKSFRTAADPILPELPLAVLVNGNTASAAEIVAGALQDLDRAVIVGQRSFGKGLVQSTRPLGYNTYLKLTTAKYYIPSGRCIQAIDYSHRNADGTVSRIPDSLTNVYSTRAGREVRDGGGITPDIKVSYPDGNRLLYSLANGFWTFDYANRFAARTPSIAPAEEFTVSDSIFQDFKEFIDPEKLDYDKYCESGLKMLREATENEGYMNDSVSAKFDELQRLLKRDFDRDFDTNKADICEILGMEISERYYPGRGQILQRLRNDIDVDSAARVLKDTARYRELLSAPQKKK